jgi:hypothetical protein
MAIEESKRETGGKEEVSGQAPFVHWLTVSCPATCGRR